jgi:hypothetical protein
MYADRVRRVFGLASGIYALGIAVRLLRRRPGAASMSSTPPEAPRPARAPSPDEYAGRGDPVREPDDARGTPISAPSPEPFQEAEHEHGSGLVDSKGADTASAPEHVILPARSELDRLPRERLFEIAHRTGHRLEHLITMSREDLIDAVAQPSDARDERLAAPPVRRSRPPATGPPDGNPDGPDVNEQAG